MNTLYHEKYDLDFYIVLQGKLSFNLSLIATMLYYSCTYLMWGSTISMKFFEALLLLLFDRR